MSLELFAGYAAVVVMALGAFAVAYLFRRHFTVPPHFGRGR